jgi:RNA polymerase sigma factor (sigma-70 family)
MLAGDSATAEDLVQDTLAKLYPTWSRVDAADNPVAYVRRSLTNLFLTSRRRASATELVTASVPDRATADASRAVVNRAYTVQLLANLSDRQRAAVVMRYLHDMTDQEIAASIGCRPVTARSLVSRALSAMRTESDRIDGLEQGVGQGSTS